MKQQVKQQGLAQYAGTYVEYFASVDAMVAFVESHGDAVVERIDDHAGCSHELITRDGFSVAFNGYIHRLPEVARKTSGIFVARLAEIL